MTQRFHNTRLVPLLPVVALVIACDDPTAPVPVGGEAGFLHACLTGGGCSLGLECVCGVCTRPCNTANTCMDESASATCNPVGTPNGACMSLRGRLMCDVNCTVSADCRSLGSGYTCESGSCRKLSAGACVHQGRIYADGTATCDDRASTDGGMDAMIEPIVSIPEPPCVAVDTDAGGPDLTPLVPPPVCAEASTALQQPGVELVATGPMAATNGTGPWGSGNKGFAVTESDVYWISPDSEAFTSPARIVRASRTEPGLWSLGSIGDALALHVDGCRVYWIEREYNKPPAQSGAHVYSSQIDQFDPRPLTDFGFYNHIGIPLALDAAHIYFRADSLGFPDATHRPALYRVARGGGTPEVVDRDPTSELLVFALHSDRVVWALDGALWSMPKDRSLSAEMLASGLNSPIAIAADDTHVYIANSATSDANLARVPIGGGAPTLLRNALVTSIAPYAERLYWIENRPDMVQELWSAPKNDLALAARIAENVSAFHVGHGEVHWLGTCGTEQTSFVLRINTSQL